MLKISTSLLLIIISTSSYSFDKFNLKGHGELKEIFTKKLGVNVIKINKSPLHKMYEVFTNKGVFYASEDGEYIMEGNLYSVRDKVVSYTESSKKKFRTSGIGNYKKDAIVYKASNEKHTVTVFTDFTCGYCRKFHKHILAFQESGITIRYLPYLRAGVKGYDGEYTDVYKDMLSVWCASKPKLALSHAKAGKKIPKTSCKKPVEEMYNFARSIGVNSTPTLVFDNGAILPGYRTPRDLKLILNRL